MLRHRIVFMTLLVLGLTPGCGTEAPSSSPERGALQTNAPLAIDGATPASERLATFVNTVRTGDEAAIEAMIHSDMAGFLQEIPIDDHVSELMNFHPGFSQLTFHALVRDEPDGADGLFYNTESTNWVKVGVKVEKEAPHRIVEIALEPASAPATD